MTRDELYNIICKILNNFCDMPTENIDLKIFKSNILRFIEGDRWDYLWTYGKPPRNWYVKFSPFGCSIYPPVFSDMDLKEINIQHALAQRSEALINKLVHEYEDERSS